MKTLEEALQDNQHLRKVEKALDEITELRTSIASLGMRNEWNDSLSALHTNLKAQRGRQVVSVVDNYAHGRVLR